MIFILITTTHYNALAKEHEHIFLVFSRFFFFVMEIVSLLNYMPTDYQSTSYLFTDYLPTSY